MSHRIIIDENGEGTGGAAVASITWTPSHELSGNEQMRRVEKVQKHLEKIKDILYAPADSQANE